MFDKVLIAARGEIAIRIARTCERMGVGTVAIHGAADARGLHVASCDEAVQLEHAEVTDPTALAGAIAEAARNVGAQAIHPGYEAICGNSLLARAAADAGIAFVGPPAEAIERLESSEGARSVAMAAGVRALHAYPASSDASELHDFAHELGFPVALRVGDDGSARQVACDEEELSLAIARCREALGDASVAVTLEAALERPRILEVQLLCDAHGQCVALGEREQSIRMGDRALLDESPSPALTGIHGELKRDVIANAATNLAIEGGLQGAGSARFLLDVSGGLHCVGFVPRLSGSHALAEMCTGLDLVELSLRIAAGERLAQELMHAQGSGHAVQARVRAELGGETTIETPLETLRWPSVAPGALRVETGLQPGAPMSHVGGDLIARLFTYAPTRHQALLTLDRVLAETSITPHETNLGALRRVLGDESFRAGQYDCEFTERLLAEP